MTPPSDTELELLKQLWRKGPLSAREVQDLAGPALDWTASTTRTVLERMRGKGLVVRRSVHGLAVYEAADNKVSVIGAMLRRMGDFLEIDSAVAASAFSGSQLLSDVEAAELEALLAEADSEGAQVMNAWLVAAALGLLAAWPLTAAGSVVGLVAERLTRSPRVREITWGAVFILPLLFLLQVLGGRVLRRSASATTPVAAAHMVRVHLTLPLSSLAPPSAPPLLEALLARPETVWVAIAILALSLAGAIARLAMWVAGRQRLAFVDPPRVPLDAHDLDQDLGRGGRAMRVSRRRRCWSAKKSTDRCSPACVIRQS